MNFKNQNQVKKKQLNKILEEKGSKWQAKDNIASVLRKNSILLNKKLGPYNSLLTKQTSISIINNSNNTNNNHFGVNNNTSYSSNRSNNYKTKSLLNLSKTAFSSISYQNKNKSNNNNQNEDDKIKRANSVHNMLKVNKMKSESLKISNKNKNSNKIIDQEIKKNEKLRQNLEETEKQLKEKTKKLELLETNLKKFSLKNCNSDKKEKNIVELKKKNMKLKSLLYSHEIFSMESLTDNEKLLVLTPSSSTGTLNSKENLDLYTNLEKNNSFSVDRGLNAVSLFQLHERFMQLQENKACLLEELQATDHELSELRLVTLQFKTENQAMKEEKKIFIQQISSLEEEKRKLEFQVLLNGKDKCFENYETIIEKLKTEKNILENSLEKIRKEIKINCEKYESDKDEWDQFQADLQLAVVVANDLNVDLEEKYKKIKEENENLKKRIESLIDFLNNTNSNSSNINDFSINFSSSSYENDTFINEDDNDNKYDNIDGDDKKSNSSKQISLHTNVEIGENRKNIFEQNYLINKNVESIESNKLQEENKINNIKSNNNLTNQVLTSPVTEKEFYVDNKRDIKIYNNFNKTKESFSNNKFDSVIANNSNDDIINEVLKNNNINEVNQTSKQTEERQNNNNLYNDILYNKYNKVNTLDDPLNNLVKKVGGSKRNALLSWCQKKLSFYEGVDVTNFSTSWANGVALCVLVHSLSPSSLSLHAIQPNNVKNNFKLAFDATKKSGLPIGSNEILDELLASDRPSWQLIMDIVTDIYNHYNK